MHERRKDQRDELNASFRHITNQAKNGRETIAMLEAYD
jgi:hypothetical protein